MFTREIGFFAGDPEIERLWQPCSGSPQSANGVQQLKYGEIKQRDWN